MRRYNFSSFSRISPFQFNWNNKETTIQLEKFLYECEWYWECTYCTNMRVCHGVSVCSWWYLQCNDWVRYNFLDSFANNKKSPMIKSWCVLSFFFLSVIFHVFVLLPSIQMTEITKSTADTKYNNATIAERFFLVVHDIYRFFFHSLWNAC